MADPKGPERETRGASPGVRPKSPPLDLSAADVTPKPAQAAVASAGAKTTPSAIDARASGVKGAESKADPKSASPAAPNQTAARDPKLDATPTSTAAATSAGSTASSSSAAGAPYAAGPSSAAQGRAAAMDASSKPSSSVPPTSTAAKSSSAAPSSPTSLEPARGGGSVGVLGAALAGLLGAVAAIAVVALFGRDLIGAPPAPDMSRVVAAETKLDAVGRDVAALRDRAGQAAQATDTSAIDARVAELGKAIEGSNARSETLETEIRALAARPAAVTVDTSADDALSRRLDAVETKAGSAASADTLTQLAGRVEAVGARMEGVGAAVAESLRPLEDKIAALEAELKAQPVGDPAARLVVALGAVDQALGAGRPFANELAAVKAAGGDVVGLEAAASGVSTEAALAAELSGILAGLPPVRADESASVFQRFVANAGSIVKVTPADAPAGGGPSEARLRVAAKAEAGDVAGALAERSGLDDAAKAATEAWAQKAQARIAAGEALASARTAALARLGSN